MPLEFEPVGIWAARVADAGLPVRFGWFLVPEAADPQGLVEQARLAERPGST